MTVLEVRFMEQVPSLLHDILRELKSLNKNLEEVKKLSATKEEEK